MQGLRLCLLVITLIAGFSAASFWPTCPALNSGDQDLYVRNNNCTETRACADAYCVCVGGSVANSGLATASCTPAAVKPTCATISACARVFVRCTDELGINTGNSSTCFAGLADVRTATLAVTVGAIYNESALYRACRHWTCMTINATTTNNCTLPYDYVCQTPVRFSFQIKLNGGFATILNNASAKAELTECIQSDLTNYLGFHTNVTSLSLTTGGLLVDATVAVSKDNSILKARITALTPTNTGWLVCLTQAKFASLGGNGTLSFGGPVTPSPPTPPTTPGPAPTPTPTRAGASSLTWTLAQALVALVAVLVMA
jgi:hypothetical protein